MTKRSRRNAVETRVVNLCLTLKGEEDNGNVDVALTVEVSGSYRPAKTSGPPEHCYPAEYPENEVVAATDENGRDVFALLPKGIDREVDEQVSESFKNDDARFDAMAEDDDDDRRYERSRERLHDDY